MDYQLEPLDKIEEEVTKARVEPPKKSMDKNEVMAAQVASLDKSIGDKSNQSGDSFDFNEFLNDDFKAPSTRNEFGDAKPETDGFFGS